MATFNLRKFKEAQEAKAAAADAAAANVVADEPAKKRRKNATSTKNLPGWVLNGWRQRAKRAKIHYDLQPAQLEAMWVEQRGFCAVTGRPMNLTKNDPCRVSVDRVDPAKGYMVDNVRLVCTSVNYARHTLTDDDLKELLKDMQWIDRLREARNKWKGSGNWYTDGVLRPQWEKIFGRKKIDPTI